MTARPAALDLVKSAALRARRAVADSHRLFWYNDVPNFGDQIAPYLYRRITGRSPVYMRPADSPLNAVYITVGSIAEEIRSNSIVWGTGIIRRTALFPRPLLTTAVRGPLTRQRFVELGFSCPEVFGDPGLLLPVFLQVTFTREFAIGLVPHYVDYEQAIACQGGTDDLLIIDVRRPLEEVVREIARCRAVVSSSLHGVIAAHAYGIPAVPVSFGDKLFGDDVKFLDYAMSVGIGATTLRSVMLGQQTAADWVDMLDARWQPGALQPLVESLFAACPFPRTAPNTSTVHANH